jgi:hypothetical protein
MDFSILLSKTREEPTQSGGRVRISESELSKRLEVYESQNSSFEATSEHLEALIAIFNKHHNVFLTGGAGTGKTTFVKQVVIPELDFRNLNWSVTATTGIAGSHLNGKTLNSFFGIGLGPEWKSFYPSKIVEFLPSAKPGEEAPAPQDMSSTELKAWYAMFFDKWINDKSVKPHIKQGVISRLTRHEVVIIDEISMCAGDGMLGYLDYMLKNLRNSNNPFGGLQVVFIGDFAQLPPVEKRNDISRSDWAFLSRSWNSGGVHAVELTKVFRQGDQDFVKFLNNVRGGSVTQADKDYATKFVRKNMTTEETRLYPFLMTHNEQVREINSDALKHYPGPTYPLEAEFVIVPQLQTIQNWEKDNQDKIKTDLIKALGIVEPVINVRIGTPVMFTMNDRDGHFVNGTRGFIKEVNIVSRHKDDYTDYDTLVVAVLEDDSRSQFRYITLRRASYSRLREQNPYAQTTVPLGFNEKFKAQLPNAISLYPTIRQFPIIPATAITIHKCVDKSTVVPTSIGMQRIADICASNPIPYVHGLTGLTAASEPFVGTVELGYRITTKRGYSLVCSERHPLLVVADSGPEWVKAPDLKVGDTLRMRGATHAYGSGSLPEEASLAEFSPRTKDHRIPTYLSEDLSWVLGVLIGDGCVSDKRDHRMDVTSMDPEVYNRFADVISTEFEISTTLKPQEQDSKARVVYAHNKGVRTWLKSIGLSHATAGDKHVPFAILRGSKEQQVAFLRGYFDADGGVNTAVHVTSKSRRLIGEVHLMLLNMGIVSTVATMKRAWRINITGVDIIKFRNLVGFSIPYKAEACARRAPDHRKVPKVQCGFYPVEYGKSIAQRIRDELTNVRRNSGFRLENCAHWAQFLNRARLGKVGLSDAHLAAMQRDLPQCVMAGCVSQHEFNEAIAGCFLDEIATIERAEGDMRDICVPDGHAFVGNGFVNHNSQGASLDSGILALDGSFAAGQVYVALSRLRSPSGLVLTDADFKVKTDPYVMEYYRSVREQNETIPD